MEGVEPSSLRTKHLEALPSMLHSKLFSEKTFDPVNHPVMCLHPH